MIADNRQHLAEEVSAAVDWYLKMRMRRLLLVFLFGLAASITEIFVLVYGGWLWVLMLPIPPFAIWYCFTVGHRRKSIPEIHEAYRRHTGV